MKKRDWTTFNEMLPWLLMPTCGCLFIAVIVSGIFWLGWWIGGH